MKKRSNQSTKLLHSRKPRKNYVLKFTNTPGYIATDIAPDI